MKPRTSRIIRIAILVALVGSFVIAMLLPDSRAKSYAYVTACSCRTTGEYEYCDIAAMLPAAIIATKPSGRSPELLDGATVVRKKQRDANWDCGDLEHTWRPVRFDPDDRATVSFDLPRAGGDYLMVGVFVVILFAAVGPKLRRWLDRIETPRE